MITREEVALRRNRAHQENQRIMRKNEMEQGENKAWETVLGAMGAPDASWHDKLYAARLVFEYGRSRKGQHDLTPVPIPKGI